MKKLLLIVPLFLAACDHSYDEQLQQKLAGKSEQEKRVLLARECANEIKMGSKPEHERNKRYFQKMKIVCEEMTGQKL